ncbi:septum formation family protein [Nocardioides lijunqiniae]|uniref:septum formation family protein n=1 Tax=Nocardioides lijunqiniae TaxID=2760832 RepID=UPI001878A755|nr:septum formation family protein [Nocardioides lijunqiniae]
MLRTALRSLLVTVAAAALVAGPSLADAAPAQRAGDPTFHMQPVGSCHALTYKQLMSESTPATAVPCTEAHTSRTIAEVRLTGKVDWKDVDALWAKKGAKRCLPAWRSALGGNVKTRGMATYVIAWFVPTAAERRQGAAWIRCDVVLLGGKKLQPLPTDGRRLLPVPLDDSVAYCLSPKGLMTVCARAHTYRAVRVFPLAGKRYPGDKRIDAIAARKCPKVTGTKKAYWNHTTAEGWKYGERLIRCLAKTRR